MAEKMTMEESKKKVALAYLIEAQSRLSFAKDFLGEPHRLRARECQRELEYLIEDLRDTRFQYGKNLG